MPPHVSLPLFIHLGLSVQTECVLCEFYHRTVCDCTKCLDYPDAKK